MGWVTPTDLPLCCPTPASWSGCGSARRTAPWIPCSACDSRGWRCTAGSRRSPTSCSHLQRRGSKQNDLHILLYLRRQSDLWLRRNKHILTVDILRSSSCLLEILLTQAEHLICLQKWTSYNKHSRWWQWFMSTPAGAILMTHSWGPGNAKWHLRVSAALIIIYCNFMSFQSSTDFNTRCFEDSAGASATIFFSWWDAEKGKSDASGIQIHAIMIMWFV